jgi:AcrR family transcriptional regulator
MSWSTKKGPARAPQRERGKRRVAALLQAAGSLLAEKSYDAMTLTEIAERAGASIGSLYLFFPSKEALADALLDRFSERLRDVLNGIEERAATLSIPALADALLGLLDGFNEERATVTALIEWREEASARASELRLSLRRHVARILRARIPTIPPKRAEGMAVVIVQLMKAAAAQGEEKDLTIRRDVLNELSHVTQIYLMDPAAHGVEDESSPAENSAPLR